MIKRIYKPYFASRNGNNVSADLNTIIELLLSADQKVNLFPNRSCVDLVSETDTKDNCGEFFREIHVKWIGRDTVTGGLSSNQIPLHVVDFSLLPEEHDAVKQQVETSQADIVYDC